MPDIHFTDAMLMIIFAGILSGGGWVLRMIWSHDRKLDRLTRDFRVVFMRIMGYDPDTRPDVTTLTHKRRRY